MQEPETNLREQKAATRRAQILHAATTVFAEKGFHRTTTREIADAAGVAEGTIYNYFENKRDLLLSIMKHLAATQDAQEALDEALKLDARSFFHLAMQARRAFVTENFAMLQVALSEVLTDPELSREYTDQLLEPTMALLETHLAARMAQGELDAVDPALLARLWSATLVGLFFFQVLGDPDVNRRWDEITGLYTNLLLDGVQGTVPAPSVAATDPAGVEIAD